MKQDKIIVPKAAAPAAGRAGAHGLRKRQRRRDPRLRSSAPLKERDHSPWKGGTGSIPVLANQPYDIELINPDNGWLTLDTEGRGTHFTGDDYFKFQATTNDGFPRMEGIRLWTHNRAGYRIHQTGVGFITPKLNSSTRSIMVLGDGGCRRRRSSPPTSNWRTSGSRFVYTSADEGVMDFRTSTSATGS